MPSYNTYLNALDAIIRENNGSIPDLATPYTSSIVSRDASQHTGLTVGDVLKGAFNELSVIRPSYDDVRALSDFYHPSADYGIQVTVKNYVERLKSVATVS